MAARWLDSMVRGTTTQTVVDVASVAATIRTILGRARPNGVRGRKSAPSVRWRYLPGAALLVGSVSMLAAVASAQTAASTDDSGGLAEIVVTAQKRNST